MWKLIILISLNVSLVISFLVGNLGRDRKIGYVTSFLVSFLLSPILGLLMIIASPQITNDGSDRKKVNLMKRAGIFLFILINVIYISIVVIPNYLKYKANEKEYEKLNIEFVKKTKEITKLKKQTDKNCYDYQKGFDRRYNTHEIFKSGYAYEMPDSLYNNWFESELKLNTAMFEKSFLKFQMNGCLSRNSNNKILW